MVSWLWKAGGKFTTATELLEERGAARHLTSLFLAPAKETKAPRASNFKAGKFSKSLLIHTASN